MDHTLTEQQLLQQLNIPDWRHMSKDKLITFANNMQNLDPEVAKAAIAQFPKFSEMGTGIVDALKDSLDNVILNDREADAKAYEINYAILNNLDKRLQKRFLFPSERKQIIDAMLQVSDNIAQMQIHEKNMVRDVAKAVGAVAGLVIAVGGTLLGVNFLKRD